MIKWFKKHTSQGLEVPNTRPLEVALDPRPYTLAEQMARFLRDPELVQAVQRAGTDTFDEANDLGPEEKSDDFGRTPYEMVEDDEPLLRSRAQEVQSGLVENLPPDRLQRAQDRLRDAEMRKKGWIPKAEAEAPKAEAGAKKDQQV